MAKFVEPSSGRKVVSALLLLVGIALGARLIWAFLEPILPTLIALTFVAILAYMFFGRRS